MLPCFGRSARCQRVGNPGWQPGVVTELVDLCCCVASVADVVDHVSRSDVSSPQRNVRSSLDTECSKRLSSSGLGSYPGSRTRPSREMQHCVMLAILSRTGHCGLQHTECDCCESNVSDV